MFSTRRKKQITIFLVFGGALAFFSRIDWENSTTCHASFSGINLEETPDSANLFNLNSRYKENGRSSEVLVNMLQKRSDWKSVNHPTIIMSVYRAYSFIQNANLSSRPEEVTILASYVDPKGAARLPRKITVSCQFYYSTNSTLGNSPVTVPGRINKLPYFSINAQYPGNFVKCRIPEEHSIVPSEVTVLLCNQTTSSARLQIQYQTVPPKDIPESEKHYRFQFSVCVMPIFDYNDVFHFLEWMEFYKLMGVHQFSFYNLSIGPDLSCVLNYLQENPQEGAFVNVDPWMGYPLVREKIRIPRHGHGMADSIYDCILRHKGVSKYLALVDLDEFIMPREENGLHNYSDMIKALDASIPYRFAEYRFQNGFYRRSQSKDKLLVSRCKKHLCDFERAVCQRLYMMRCAGRNPYEGPVSRTKYICRPEAVERASLHIVDETVEGYDFKLVPVDVAFIRHYRADDAKLFGRYAMITTDRVSEQFGARLSWKVAKKMKFFMDKCNINISNIIV